MTRRGIGVASRVLSIDGEGMLVDVVLVGVMQVAVVEVVDVSVVLDGGVTAAAPVNVGMVGVNVVLGHLPTVRGERLAT